MIALLHPAFLLGSAAFIAVRKLIGWTLSAAAIYYFAA